MMQWFYTQNMQGKLLILCQKTGKAQWMMSLVVRAHSYVKGMNYLTSYCVFV